MITPQETVNSIMTKINEFTSNKPILNSIGINETAHSKIKNILSSLNNKTYTYPLIATLTTIVSIVIIAFTKSISNLLKVVLLLLLLVSIAFIALMAKAETKIIG